MKYFIKIFLGCILAFTFSACVRTTAVPTELKVQVLDDQGYPVAGAHVDLFETKTDYLNSTNIVLTTTTDQNGYIYVYNLSPISYYYFISVGCLDNTYTTNRLTSPLVPNVINVYDPIFLSVVGKIKVENNSSFYPCDIYLDGNTTTPYYSGLAVGAVLTIPELQAGNHTVEVYNGHTDEVFHTTISCGVTPTISFP